MYQSFVERLKAEQGRDITSFLMIGQSNMAGRGDFGEVPPIENEVCFMLRNGRWVPMSEPINPDRPVFGTVYHCGVGLAASFADAVARDEGHMVGLIPCADGGTIIEQWMPGEALYDNAVMCARLALRSSHLGGIIWHHGESNCSGDIADYEKRAFEVLSSIRRELNAEELPLIMGEISEHIDDSWGCEGKMHEMNLAIHRISERLPNSAVASSEGLELKADGIHFTSASARKMGIRYFEAYKKLR